MNTRQGSQRLVAILKIFAPWNGSCGRNVICGDAISQVEEHRSHPKKTKIKLTLVQGLKTNLIGRFSGRSTVMSWRKVSFLGTRKVIYVAIANGALSSLSPWKTVGGEYKLSLHPMDTVWTSGQTAYSSWGSRRLSSRRSPETRFMNKLTMARLLVNGGINLLITILSHLTVRVFGFHLQPIMI